MRKMPILKEWSRLEDIRAALFETINNLPDGATDDMVEQLGISLSEVERRIANLRPVTAAQAIRRLEITLGTDEGSGALVGAPSWHDLIADVKRLSVNIRHVTIPLHLAVAAIVAGPVVGAMIALSMAVLP